MLKTLPSDKSPGPDRFSRQYFLHYADLLPHLTVYFNSLTKTVRIIPEALRANITIVPKEGKDSVYCQNYRPISLLYLDIKVLVKILANCLKEFQGDLVHADQVGFILCWEGRDNSQRAVSLLYWIATTKTPSLVLSSDTVKLFDRIDWIFKDWVLHRLGLGDKMRSWIAALYTNPTAQVKVNQVLYQPLQISNGTRQVVLCPLCCLLWSWRHSCNRSDWTLSQGGLYWA